MILRYKNGKLSDAYHLLTDVERESGSEGFVIPGWNRPLYQRLERLRWANQIETHYSGPQHGKRYFITDKGKEDLNAALL